MPSLTAASYICRKGEKNARDKNKPGHCPLTDKEKTVAVKKNANTSTQTEPATDAAVVEAAGGTAEQSVMPEQEGSGASVAASLEGQGKPDNPPEDGQRGGNEDETQTGTGTPLAEDQGGETPPEMSLHVNGKVITDSGASEQPILFEGSNPNELEPVCTIGPEDMNSFADAVCEATASLIAGAGFFVRQDGEQVSPFGKDILAVSFRQGKGFTAVAADGRKFVLKDGEVNEA